MDDDTKLDVEALGNKNEELKKLDEMATDPDKFEDIERDFKLFLEEIVGVPNLKRFKEDYQKIYKTLKTSYESERKLIAKAKGFIADIWDNAQNVKSALRMANNEADKIEELKRRVEEESTKVAAKREEEEDKRASIASLQFEIAALNKKASEAHELPEEVTLKALRKEMDELTKQREDQQTRMETQRARQDQLLSDKQNVLGRIHTTGQHHEDLRKQIQGTLEDQNKMEGAKSDLEARKKELKEQKEAADQTLEELKKDIDKQKEQRTSRQFELVSLEGELKELNK